MGGFGGNTSRWLLAAGLLLSGCGTGAGSTPVPPSSEPAVDADDTAVGDQDRRADAPPADDAAPLRDDANDMALAAGEPVGLAELTCDDLSQDLSVALPLEGHASEEMWAEAGGDSYRAGCMFEAAGWQLGVEVHAATPEEHSVIWDAPGTQAARDAQRIDGVGDEAYTDEWLEGGANVTARQGLVEVYVYQRRLGEDAAVEAPFEADELLSATASLMERWPSGPGAAPPPVTSVPDVPLPPDVTDADLRHFDPADPQWEGVYDDSPDVHEFFTFGDARGNSEDYCARLRSQGYAEEPIGEYEGIATCIVVDQQWRIIVSGTDGTFGAQILRR